MAVNTETARRLGWAAALLLALLGLWAAGRTEPELPVVRRSPPPEEALLSKSSDPAHDAAAPDGPG